MKDARVFALERLSYHPDQFRGDVEPAYVMGIFGYLIECDRNPSAVE